MIELIKDYLMEWRKAPEIVKVLKDKGVHAKNLKNLNRKFRDAVAKYNLKYQAGQTDLFLAHSSKGYRLTSDSSEIAASLLDDRKRGLKLLKRYYSGMRSLSEMNQLSLSAQDTDLFEIITRMNV